MTNELQPLNKDSPIDATDEVNVAFIKFEQLKFIDDGNERLLIL